MQTHQAIAGLTLAALSLGCATQARSQDVCERTAHRMRSACGAEISDDWFTAQAICFNESDEDALECFADARADFQDGLSECRDQRDARLDLCDLLGDDGPFDPDLDPENFVSPADAAANPNPYFPLVPGYTWTYEAEDEVIIVTVTEDTREIDGVETTAVRDIAMEEGEVVEDTIDWYAQDEDGNVWYFGEISRNFEDGYLIDVEGSFLSGEDGAKAGVIMFANPMVGDVYRQEFALGEAEDAGEVIATMASETVPAASCDGTCVVVRDFTPLEPDANEEKYFAPGIGLILEVDLEEDGARVELVEFSEDG